MSFTSVAALSFQPSTLPALGNAVARTARPAMLLDAGAFSWIADAAPVLMPDAAAQVAPAAQAAAEQDPGLFDLLLVKPFESAIVALHGGLSSIGVDGAYGFAIIVFTLALKALTFPLNKQQIESTSKMQAIQPAAKQLQEKYRNKDPARLNMELQKLYADNQVNPLAGCLPAFAQIPIFIGLYRSVLNLAKEDKLTEPFLWLPSLEGPVSDYTQGTGWLFGDAAKGYNWDGLTPPLGWSDTLAYLVLPVALVISQYISTAILTPKSDDPAQQQSQAILKFLPLMIGWFSLSVPSGLGLYWMTNNIVTTLSTVLIRKSVATPALANDAPPSSVSAAPPKPQGFGRQYGEVIKKDDGDTTVTITPPGTRKERRAAAAAAATSTAAASDVIVDATVVPTGSAAPAAAPIEADAMPVADAGVAAAAKPLKKKKKRSKKSKK